MEKISGWFAGKAAEKEINSMGESFANMVEDASKTATTWYEGMLGKTQKPLPELLKGYDLPGGLMPKNLSRYEFEPTEGKEGEGKLTVMMPYPMDVKFSDGTVLRYEKKVKAQVRKGKLEHVTGVRVSGIMWMDVTGFAAEGDKVVLQARMKKSKPASLFRTPLEGVETSDVK